MFCYKEISKPNNEKISLIMKCCDFVNFEHFTLNSGSTFDKFNKIKKNLVSFVSNHYPDFFEAPYEIRIHPDDRN